MKTKHLFVSLALAGAFVGCADEDFVSNNQSLQMEARPVIGSVSLNLVNENPKSRLIGADGNVDWTGMTIGAALMDQMKTTTTGLTGLDKYELTTKLWTNYPYARTEAGSWDNDALMVEGNYFYYAPYDETLGRGNLNHTISSVQYLYDNEANPNLGMTATADLLAYNAADKNQLYVGYHGFKAGEGKDAILLNMNPAHAELQFTLFNASSENITIHKVVVYKGQAGGFQLASYLDPTRNVNYTYWTSTQSGLVSATASMPLNSRFDKLGQEVPYLGIKNPVTGAMVYEGNATPVTVVFPNYSLAKNTGLSPVRIVLPQGLELSTDNLYVSVYTSKGVMTEALVATHTGETAAAIRENLSTDEGSPVSKVVGLRSEHYISTTETEGAWLAAQATFTTLPTIEINRAMVAFNDLYEFVVPETLTVSNTAELEYYLKNWYAGKNAGTNPMTTVNVIIANENGVAINKAIYDYMKVATNPKVNVASGRLIIPNDATIPADAVMKMSNDPTYAEFYIAEGEEQTINFGATAVGKNEFTYGNKIVNYGTLNVETADAADEIRIGGHGVKNFGTFNINTPVNYTAANNILTNEATLNVNSTLTVGVLNNGSETNKTAKMVVNADNTGITELNNYGDLDINANVATKLVNNQVVEGGTPNQVYTNASVEVAEGKTLTLYTGSENSGDMMLKGMVVVYGDTENKDNGNQSATMTVNEGAELTVQNGTFMNSATVITSGFIACNSGASFDNYGELTLNEGAFTLVTNNYSGANISCSDINPELKIENDKNGFVTYVMADADTDLSARNLEINKLKITCNGTIDLTSIFECEGNASLTEASTLIKHIEITSSTASTFQFAEATMLKSLIIGGANHTIVSVDNADITCSDATKVAFKTESFKVTTGTISVANATTMYTGTTVENGGRVVVSGYFISEASKSTDAADGHNYILSTGGENRVLWNQPSATWTCAEDEH